MNFYIKTYGCQMNMRDSDAATAMLSERGHTLVEKEEQADIIIFNTCSVRKKAEDKVIGKLGFMKKLKRKNPNLILGLMGCMAQRLGDELFVMVPNLDFVIGTDQLHTIGDVVDAEAHKRHKFVSTEVQKDVLTEMGKHYKIDNKTSEFVAIMRGCDCYCTFCIVPYVRGREKSREIPDIVEEVKELAEAGIKEIILLGQNVVAYGLPKVKLPLADDNSPFADLLEAVHAVEGVERIRFASPHPAYFNDKLIKTMGQLPKVCNNVHFPLQSGSDRILKKMNRPYTSEEFIEKANKLKKHVPGITFSTDIIVGFPSETEEDFNMTRKVFNEVEFDNAYIFKYSPREGTGAAIYEDQITDEVKEERNKILLGDLKTMFGRNIQTDVGETVNVLVEGVSKRNSERWQGRTPTNRVVIFDPIDDIKAGDIIDVKVNKATAVTLFGDVV